MVCGEPYFPIVDSIQGINDPLGKTHSHASRKNNFHLNFVYFYEILKSWVGRYV